MVYLNPDNRPGGHFGDALDRVTESLRDATQPYVDASDAAVLDAASRGELVEPDPEVAATVHELEAVVNGIGAMYKAVQHMYETAPIEDLEAAFPDRDFTWLRKTRERDARRQAKYDAAGPIRRRWQRAVHFIGLAPPWWPDEPTKR